MRTFIVDPSTSHRRILSALLEAESAPRAESVDAIEAIAANGGFHRTDTIFLDASISPANLNPASVIVTGSPRQDELIAQRIKEGASTFLLKPYTRPTLLRAMEEAAFFHRRTATDPAPLNEAAKSGAGRGDAGADAR